MYNRKTIWCHARVVGVAFLISTLAVTANGQKGGGSSNSSSNSPSGGGAGGGGGGGGSVAIESQAIAYEAINELAIAIAKRTKGQCTEIPTNEETKTKAVHRNQILLAIPANITAISTYLAFKLAADALAKEYDNLIDLERQVGPLAAGGPPTPVDWISAIGGVLAAAKAQTTQSGGTFTPVDQALYSDLEREFAGSCNLVTTAYPGHIESAYKPMIFDLLDKIYKSRSQAVKDLSLALKDRKDDKGAPNPYDATKDQFMQKADAQLTSLQAAITDASASSGVPNVLLGAALLWALGERPPDAKSDYTNSYHVLTVTDDAAGGGSRANLYFFINLFVPAPHPSYNGGAVVSYSLRDKNGVYESSDTLRFVFGYTKWKQPPLRNHSNKGYENFGWTNERNKGHWEAIY